MNYMHLWNDYEGKTIADTLSLGPLVRPEGRSALFTLTGGADAPGLIRLTESINDESQMLACWSRVAEVKQENLVAIKRFGETTFEGTPLTYAVLENADANLDDLLKERPLTHTEAMQVATSLIAALKALHEQNLVHEHLVAANVLAVGETVKLRTDCVRECVVDGEFTTAEDCARFRQQDVHDLALLMLRALTLERELKPGMRLSAPFDQVIRNGIAGTWGLAQMDRLLSPPSAAPAPVVPKPLPVQATTQMPQPPMQATKPLPAAPAVPKSVEATAAASPQPTAKAPVQPPAAAPVEASAVPKAEPAKPQLDFAFSPEAVAASHNPLHFQRRIAGDTATPDRRTPILAAATVLVVVVGAMLVHFSHGKPAPKPTAAAAAQSAQQTLTAAAAPAPVVSPAASRLETAAAPVRSGWYVIAYTFNHAEQAAIRASAIARKNPSLRPQVIAPSGRGPYLVALGGPMSRPQAEAVQRRARQSGLPRDTFVRDYKGV
jgi:hypothetical protein